MKGFLYAVIIILVGMFSFSMGEESRKINEEAVVSEKTASVKSEELILPKIEERSFPDVVERVLPTVVGITAVQVGYGENMSRSMGSGVILSNLGYIVTNHHVVGDNPKLIEVTMFDGDIRKGELCWSDKTLDVAVVQVEGKIEAVAVMGEHENVRVGEDVFAIGNPLSLQFERSVTKGIVSAVNRTITIESNDSVTYMEDLIQTDASINPGNSGGPLMNRNGEVIGINTIRVKSAEGMGFAVPVNICESVIEKLETDGRFETPYLGLYAYTSQTAKYLKKEDKEKNGLFVVSLDREGPAFEGGVRYGDMITHINGVEVDTMLKLRRELFKAEIGESVILSVISSSKKKDLEVSVGKMSKLYFGTNQ